MNLQKRLLYILAILPLLVNTVYAQITPIKPADKDSSLQYIAGEGIQLRLSRKDNFRLNLLSTVQSGFQYNQIRTNGVTDKTTRLSLNLVRVALTASGFDDKLSLGLVSDFTGTSGLLEGWVGYQFWHKKAKLTVGERQTNTNNRLAMADERFLSVMAPTIAGKSVDGIAYGGLMQNFVGATREGGAFLETNFSINNIRIYPSISLTTGEGQGFFDAQQNLGFKYGGRLDIMPLGDFIKNNAFIGDDLYREPSLKLAFGVAGSYNIKASRGVGGDNVVVTGIYDAGGNTAFADYRKLVADAMLKYKGFALVAEYINTTLKGKNLFADVAAATKLSTEMASSQYSVGKGINVQSSYYCTKGWVVNGRYTHITPEFKTDASLVHQQNWYTIGVSKYWYNNALKIGINTSYMDDTTPSVTTYKWITNLAVQLSF